MIEVDHLSALGGLSSSGTIAGLIETEEDLQSEGRHVVRIIVSD